MSDASAPRLRGIHRQWRSLFPAAAASRLAWLAVLILLIGLTEGIGLLLLVPLLASMSGESSGLAGPIAGVVALLPFRPQLEPLLLVFVALVVARALLQLARAIESARLERQVVTALRVRALAALLRADWRKAGAVPQGDILSLLVSGIDRIGYGIGELVALIAAVLLLAAAFAAALVLSPSVALGALAGGVVVVFAYGVVRRRSLALGRDLSAAYARLTGRLGEILGALRLVKSFAAEERAAAELAAIDQRLTVSVLGFRRLGGVSQALLQASGAVLLALLVWAAIVVRGVSPLVLLPLIALFARVLPLLGAVQQHWHAWLNARAPLEEALSFVAAMEAAVEPRAAGIEIAPPRRSIALEQVTLRHAGRGLPALDAVDIVLPVNTTTVLVGHSGAGKSTAADVFGGLAAPDAGALALDGRALSPAERIAWRQHVAYVQQEPVLFNASLRDNLLWAAPGATPAELEQALRDASAEFALALPERLDTRVGDLGRQLSGGERQRIVLARALLRQPALLILDEPTSNLDPANEAAVAAALARMEERTTILIIGHRGLLTRRAERVVRLEHGRVAPATLGAVA